MSIALSHEVLKNDKGRAACLLGNLAVVRGALEAGIQFFSCYPGTPSSEIGDTFAHISPDRGVLFEYSVNEKIAVEIAFAACLTGARSMCAMKHLGLNYAGDPVSTLPYVGVEGGMVIVSAGDPSAITSPNEQDQRHFTRFLYYPIFDPATPADALRMTRFAFEFSEATRLPVILRTTTRVCHVSGMVEFGELPEPRPRPVFNKNPQRYAPIPPNARRMRKELTARYAKAESLLAASDFFPRRGEGRRGIIASGVAHTYAAQAIETLGIADRVSLLQIGAYPIPESILQPFIASVDSVLVVEELTPFVEEWVMLSAYRSGKQLPISGKHSGHLPLEFEYDPDLVEDAVAKWIGLAVRPRPQVVVPDLPVRPPVLCPGCPHRNSFYLARKAFGKKTVYCNDIGCYTLGYGEPLDTCDVLLCMGSSISEACGIARSTGERVVAFIGDSTFFHSGLPALANAVNMGDEVTVVILNNYITAMTGMQPSLAGHRDDPEEQRRLIETGCEAKGLSLAAAVRGLGVEELYTVDPFDEEAALAAFRKAKASDGLNVVICNAPCIINESRNSERPDAAGYAIDQELCNACGLCVSKIGCPAISIEDDRYLINQDACDGCHLCALVCSRGAIDVASSE